MQEAIKRGVYSQPIVTNFAKLKTKTWARSQVITLSASQTPKNSNMLYHKTKDNSIELNYISVRYSCSNISLNASKNSLELIRF